MYGRFGYVKLLRRRPDSGVVFRDILPELHSAFFYTTLHTGTLPAPSGRKPKDFILDDIYSETEKISTRGRSVNDP